MKTNNKVNKKDKEELFLGLLLVILILINITITNLLNMSYVIIFSSLFILSNIESSYFSKFKLKSILSKRE